MVCPVMRVRIWTAAHRVRMDRSGRVRGPRGPWGSHGPRVRPVLSSAGSAGQVHQCHPGYQRETSAAAGTWAGATVEAGAAAGAVRLGATTGAGRTCGRLSFAIEAWRIFVGFSGGSPRTMASTY